MPDTDVDHELGNNREKSASPTRMWDFAQRVTHGFTMRRRGSKSLRTLYNSKMLIDESQCNAKTIRRGFTDGSLYAAKQGTNSSPRNGTRVAFCATKEKPLLVRFSHELQRQLRSSTVREHACDISPIEIKQTVQMIVAIASGSAKQSSLSEATTTHQFLQLVIVCLDQEIDKMQKHQDRSNAPHRVAKWHAAAVRPQWADAMPIECI